MSSKRYQGPAVLSFGFRPFFLLGALSAVLLIPVWLSMFAHGGVAGYLHPAMWHIHEMIYGYLAAVIAGFLLTAIPNWTGRMPYVGLPLLSLVAIWLLGRIAMLASISPIAAAMIDCLFLVAIASVATREVLAGKNWRNSPVCLIIWLFALSNVAFHAEAIGQTGSDYAQRAAVGLLVLLNALIGGRIVPSFTTNWLIKNGKEQRPVPFNRYDKLLLIVTLAALSVWVVAPEQLIAGMALALVGFGHAYRLLRWKGWATRSSAIVFVLHAAYFWLPAGLVLLGMSALVPDAVPTSAGLHALTAGLMGLMPIAVMSRATLGHTDRLLAVGFYGALMYFVIVIGACLRVAASLMPEWYIALLYGSGLLWTLGFLMFVGRYGLLLVRPRPTNNI